MKSLFTCLLFDRYVTDAGQQISGRADAVSREEPGLYLMKGQDAPYYWVKFSDNELNNEDDFDKIVRSGKLFSAFKKEINEYQMTKCIWNFFLLF